MTMRTKFAFISLLLVIVSGAAFAQKPKSKDEALKEIAALTKKPEDFEKAYPLAKDFVARFAKDNKDGKDKAVTQVKAFVEGYRENLFNAAVDGGKFADAYALGREILAEHPDDLGVTINLAHTGYTSMGANRDKTYADEAIGYAKKAAAALESGAVPKNWAPYKDKNEALAWMYYIPGFILIDKDGKESASYIYRATMIESPIRDSSLPYYLIAGYYEDVYAKLSTELKAKMGDQKMSDADFKAANDRVNKAVDLMMDAYVRAFKKGEAEKNPNAAQWKARLTQVYKFSKKTEEGLTEFINYIITTPLPDPSKF